MLIILYGNFKAGYFHTMSLHASQVLERTIEELKTANDVIRTADERLVELTQKLNLQSLAFKEREEQLALFVEHAPAAIAMFDKGLHYLAVSKRWIDDYKLTGQEVLGRHHYDLFPEIRQMPSWIAIHQRCLEGAVEKCDEDWFLRPDGRKDWIRWEIHPWRKASGEIGGIIMFTEWITQQKWLMLELEAREKEAQTALKLRDEFLAIASHELKTPLTTLVLQIGMLSQMVLRGTIASTSPESLKKLITPAENQLKRMVDLVNELLDISRISAGKFNLNLEKGDLAEILEAVCLRFRPEADRVGCDMRVEVKGAVVGMWDRSRIDEVIANLISNALKYGAKKPVEVTLEKKGNCALVSVRDYGMGIAKVDQLRIMEKYERAVGTQHFGGLGLGLYISNQIVIAHGGTISILSEPGMGSTFFVSFPLDGGQ